MTGLTFLPELRDGSLGRTKIDRFPRWDPETQVSAAEYNVLRTAVYELAQAIGLGDGTTGDSLVAILLKGYAPQGLAPNYYAAGWYQGSPPSYSSLDLGSFAIIEEWSRVLAERWTLTSVSGGNYAIADGSAEANAIGALRLFATASGYEIHLADTTLWFVGGHWPVLRARVKVPADLADATFEIGFGDDDLGGHSYGAVLSPQPAGWDVTTTVSGTPTTASDQGTAPTPGGWHDIRIEVEHYSETLEGDVRFYVDGILIHTAQSPFAADTAMGLYGGVTWVANSGGEARIDYLDLRMNRIAAT